MTIMQKVKAVAVPVTNIVVPLGISILTATIAKEYVPKQDKKYKQVLQNVAVASITAYVSAKVTEHSVEAVEEQFDELDKNIQGVRDGFTKVQI